MTIPFLVLFYAGGPINTLAPMLSKLSERQNFIIARNSSAFLDNSSYK